MAPDPPRAVARREFVRSAVAIGGASALSACLDAETGSDDPADPEHPRGPDDPSTLPERQHAWNAYLRTEPSGNTSLPEQQLVLFFEHAGSVPPTDAERAAVEDALASIERAYRRGTGGDAGATFTDGLLFALGYAPSYFDRFDASLPPGVGLDRPETVIETLDEEAAPESADAAMVLNSDYGSILLSVEQALRGELSTINGVAVEGDFASAFEPIGRRPAVVGRGNPAEELDHEGIAAEAPLSMGYKSGFDDSNPSEDAVTVPDGPFADGTTMLISRLGIDLDRWYDLDEEARATRMFATGHDPADVGTTGEGLGGHSRIDEDDVADLEETAAEHGCLGHSQKVARARDDDFEPTILRRSEGNVTDPAHDAGMNFTSIQRRIADFVGVREAMNDLGGVDPRCSGIVDFLTVERRGTYLVPPRSLRALPSPRPDRA